MNSQYFDSPDEQRLAEALRRDAAAERPAFSEALHRRIMAAVGRQPPAPPRRDHAAWGRRWIWVVAAGLLLSATAALWYSARPGAGPERRVAQPGRAASPAQEAAALAELQAMARVPDRTAAQLDVWAQSNHSRRWAYLDHDAQVATRLFMEPLPLDMLATAEK